MSLSRATPRPWCKLGWRSVIGSVPLWRAVGDRAGEAATLHNIGRVYDDLGEKQQALDYFNQALLLSRAVGHRAGEATILTNIENTNIFKIK